MSLRVFLCSPDFFRVDYSINPHMKPGTTDIKLAWQQWRRLYALYKRLGIKVEVIKQDKKFPDMVFAADQCVSFKGHVILSNFRFAQRRGETELYKSFFIKNGYNVLDTPNNVYFEGSGETFILGDRIYLGYGKRTTKSAAGYIKKITGKKVVALKLVNPEYFHLDTCFLPLDKDTAFYYPPAFDKNSRQTLEDGFENIFKFTKKEAEGFAANSFVYGKKIITGYKDKPFIRRLRDLGYKVYYADVSEFLKAGGGVHCLTGVLDEVYYVYIIRTDKNTLYTGITNNLNKRFQMHMSKKGSKYMRSFQNFELVYKQVFDTKSEALKRELQIKKMRRKEKERLLV